MDAGPPSAMTTNSGTRNHRGGVLPSPATTVVHPARVIKQTPNAIGTRATGRLPMSQPRTGLAIAAPMTPHMSTAPAPDVVKPALVVRYGPPHSTPNAVVVDMQAKCTQKPRRVPGRAQAPRTRVQTPPTALRSSSGPRSRRGGG